MPNGALNRLRRAMCFHEVPFEGGPMARATTEAVLELGERLERIEALIASKRASELPRDAGGLDDQHA